MLDLTEPTLVRRASRRLGPLFRLTIVAAAVHVLLSAWGW